MTSATVIVPAFDAADTIVRCVEGLLAGVLRPDQLIVVDNGSCDDTSERARRAGAEVVSCLRPGPAAARNAGLSRNRSDVVALIDADGVPSTNWLASLVAGLEGSNHGGVGGRIVWSSERTDLAKFYQGYYPDNEQTSTHARAPYLLTGNAAFRAAALEELGGFDASLRWCEDLDLGIRLAASGASLGYVHEAEVAFEVPTKRLDRIAQFYKYGFGLRAVMSRHPEAFTWEVQEELEDFARSYSKAIASGRSEQRSAMLQTAYFAGWLDARLRVQRRSIELRRLGRIGMGPGAGSITITIDDGPTASTPELLAALAQHRATACFFLLGERAKARPDSVRAIVEAGHEVFSHGWSHRRFDCLSHAEIRDELEQTEAILSKYRPTPSPYPLRLPFGAGADDPHVHDAISRWRRDVVIVEWSHDIEDWRLDGRSYRLACQALMARQDLEGGILLLHDEPFGVPVWKGRLIIELLREVVAGLTDRNYSTHGLGAAL